MPIMIQLRRILIHNLLCKLDSILSFRRRHRVLIVLQLRRIGFWLVGKQVHNSAFACGSLIDGEASAELAMSADLNCFEEFDCEVLAVVADEVVGGSG